MHDSLVVVVNDLSGHTSGWFFFLHKDSFFCPSFALPHSPLLFVSFATSIKSATSSSMSVTMHRLLACVFIMPRGIDPERRALVRFLPASTDETNRVTKGVEVEWEAGALGGRERTMRCVGRGIGMEEWEE